MEEGRDSRLPRDKPRFVGWYGELKSKSSVALMDIFGDIATFWGVFRSSGGGDKGTTVDGLMVKFFKVGGKLADATGDRTGGGVRIGVHGCVVSGGAGSELNWWDRVGMGEGWCSKLRVLRGGGVEIIKGGTGDVGDSGRGMRGGVGMFSRRRCRVFGRS